MYVKDEVAVSYLAGAVLLTFPWLGVIWGTWGIIWEVILLLAVFLLGRRNGLIIAAVCLFIGYAIPSLGFGVSAFNQMTLVPFAGLLGVWGWQKHWPVRVTFFWGAALAAILGAIPVISFAAQGIDSKTLGNMVNAIIQQYQTSGLLKVLKQQGIDEVQFRDSLQQFIQVFVLIMPGLEAIVAIAEFGVVFSLVRRWFRDEDHIAFTHWRLPWYSVWGVILGIALYLLGDQFSWTVMRGIGINIMVVYAALALMLGISVYIYLLKSPKIPRILKWAIIIASFLYFFLSVVSLIMFGLFDLVFNFRHLPEKM
jgi:hypothetical protein